MGFLKLYLVGCLLHAIGVTFILYLWEKINTTLGSTSTIMLWMVTKKQAHVGMLWIFLCVGIMHQHQGLMSIGSKSLFRCSNPLRQIILRHAPLLSCCFEIPMSWFQAISHNSSFLGTRWRQENARVRKTLYLPFYPFMIGANGRAPRGIRTGNAKSVVVFVRVPVGPTRCAHESDARRMPFNLRISPKNYHRIAVELYFSHLKANPMVESLCHGRLICWSAHPTWFPEGNPHSSYSLFLGFRLSAGT